MGFFNDKVVVITGAGSGIGRALALALAERGARLALSDIDEAGLGETAALARALRAEVEMALFDVRDAGAFAAHAAAARDRFGVVHQLYNNAGTGRGSGAFLDMCAADFDAILAVNFAGVVNGSRAFLPHLIASGAGALINISSLNGLMAQGGLSAYVASKFAVRGFTEALRVEMLSAGHRVQVTLVHPGGVKTNIANGLIDEDAEMSDEERQRAQAAIRLYNERFLTMSAQAAARRIVEGVARGESRIVFPRQARLIDALVRFLPARYPRLVAAVQRRLADKLGQ